MIRIRKHNGEWQLRWRRYQGNKRTWHWGNKNDLYDLQQIIIEFAAHMDHYIRIALDVVAGKSETYLYQDGNLVRRKPLQNKKGQRFCLTMYLRHIDEVETTIKHIESGVWKVRRWTPPASFADRVEFRLLDKKIRQEYLIVETRDDSLVPFEVIT